MRTQRRKRRPVPYPDCGAWCNPLCEIIAIRSLPQLSQAVFGFVRTGRVEIRTQRGSVVMQLKSQLDCWTTGRSGKESAQHLSATSVSHR
jgi:hypothetical protein